MDSRGKCALVVAACCLARSRLVPARSPEPTFVPAGGRLPGAAQLRQEGILATASAAAPTSGSAQSGPDLLATVAAAAAAGFAGGIASRCGRAVPRTPCLGKKKGGKGGGGGKRGGAQEAPAGNDDEEASEIDTEELMMDWEDKITKTCEMLRTDLVGIRAGKATPALLDSLKVKAYDSQMGINEVGTVTVTDATTLQVTVFDEDVAPAVEKAVRVSDLGYGVQSAGAVIRISIPELTKDKRQQYIKLAKEATEKARVAVRNVRQGAMKKVKQLSKKLSEDVAKTLQKDIEDLVKKNIADLDKMLKNKETELSKV